MPEGKRWRLAHGVDLVWREWASDSVAYERFSGDLHRFDAATAALLQCLSQTPLDEQAVIDAVARRLALDGDSQLGLFIRQSLSQLLSLGLVEQA